MRDRPYHIPVLAEQVLSALAVKPGGNYLDGTAGGGGHARLVASRLTTGWLIALDRDPDAVAAASQALEGLPAAVVQANYTEMGQVLDGFGIRTVAGILLDIGVSSHQLDTPERGFSYHAEDALLDMRMCRTGGSAADLVNTLEQAALADIFFRFGEEKFSRSIARAVVKAREAAPITTCGELAAIVSGAVPAAARRDGHPARRVFQALRIAVNGELDALAAGLDTAFERLAVGGRLAVITFHSLEDKIVKDTFNGWKKSCTCPKGFPVCICGRTPAARVFAPVKPEPAEIAANPRARSAKLRVLEKIKNKE
ncbi:MAG: 16S rRNA (cytosine(1402)-N(4))-methyltransferase RsmH [Oscillospiraceae bacterium]|nr:16S rRNA (cytosine(1402)-N(4))-methyltransferase RsmH [Oscillospiraceae bacterium]